MSSALQWMIIRNCSSHLVKKRNIKKHFSTDPFNLKNIHSLKYSGLIHKKALMIEPHSSNNGVSLTYKKRKYRKRPSRNVARVPLTKGGRRTMTSIKKFVNSNCYRKDLKMAALRRASAVLKSQRPIVPKKKSPKKKPE